MRTRTVAGLMTLGMLAAGCGDAGGGGGGTSPSPSASATTPAANALTEAQARAIFTKYQKTNNQANAHLSDKTLSTIETGAMLKGDLADYKVTRAGLDSKIKPFSYHSPRFYIPRNADWFAVDAKPTGGGEEFLVFAASGGTYKLATSAWKDKTSFPAIARGADGSATAVTTPPTTKVAAAHSEYLTNVAAGLRGSGFASGALTSKLGTQWHGFVNKITSDPSWRGGTTWKPADYPVYALATADGGALVWYTATQALDYRTGNPTAWYRPDKPFFAFGPQKYHHDYHGTWLWRFAAHLPKDGGNTTVLASGHLPIGASGS